MQRITGAVIKLPEQVRRKALIISYYFVHEIFLQGTSTGEETSVHIVGSFYSIQVCVVSHEYQEFYYKVFSFQSAQRRLRAMVQHPHSLPAASLAGLPLLPNGGSGPEAGPAPQQPLTSP